MVKRPELIRYGGTDARPVGAFLERIPCHHCSALCLEGQRICFDCGGPVKPGSLKARNRRTQLAREREALIDQLATENDALEAGSLNSILTDQEIPGLRVSRTLFDSSLWLLRAKNLERRLL